MLLTTCYILASITGRRYSYSQGNISKDTVWYTLVEISSINANDTNLLTHFGGHYLTDSTVTAKETHLLTPYVEHY
jgi:hypothetical protein